MKLQSSLYYSLLPFHNDNIQAIILIKWRYNIAIIKIIWYFCIFNKHSIRVYNSHCNWSYWALPSKIWGSFVLDLVRLHFVSRIALRDTERNGKKCKNNALIEFSVTTRK